MKVIALQGRYDRGKTSTLKRLIALLCLEGSPIACGQRKKVDPNISQLKDRLAGDDDLWVLLSYRNKIVAVTTEGDEWLKIKANIDKMEEVAAKNGFCIDIFICAIRNSPEMLTHIQSLDKDPHIVTQYAADMENYLEVTSQISNLSQAVILKNIVRIYAP